MNIAASVGIGVPRLKREMKSRGIKWKTPAEALAGRQEKLLTNAVWRKKVSENAKRLAETWGKSEANRKRMRRLGMGQRGIKRPHTEQELLKRSATHQQRVIKLSPSAVTLNDWLIAAGAVTTLEQAEGRYNIDIAVGAVAVEVHRYGFNPLGRSASASRLRQRANYLRNRGWLMCYVWIGPRGQWLTAAAAEYIVALAKSAESDPSLRGEYRVIRGSGELVAAIRGDGDESA